MGMIDREKAIKGLECCLSVTKCGTCPYNTGNDSWCGNNNQLLEDALALLKAQEPHRKGYWIYPLSTDCSCSECGNQPEHEPGGSVPLYDYCPYCGAEMEVKWK